MLEEKYLSATKRVLDSKQVSVECTLTLEQGQIEKVLALSTDSYVNTVETFEKETKLNGEVYAHLIYLTPQGEMGSVACTCAFADSIKHDALGESEKLKADARVVSVSPSAISENTLKVLATVEMSFVVEGNAKTSMFSSQSSNNCILEGELPLQVLVQDVGGNFVCEKTVETKDQINNILVVDSSAVLKDVQPGVGYVSVQGDVYTYLIYAKADGSLVHSQVTQSFKEELEVDQCHKDCLIEAVLQVKKAETTATVEEKQEGANITISTPLKAFVKVFENQQFTTVKDIYSLTNELEINKQTLTNTNVLPSKYFEAKLEGNLTLTEKEPRIDKVLTVSAPRLMISNHYVSQGEVFVQGIVHTNVIYLNDEESTIHSVELEVSFSTSEKVGFDEQEVLCKVQVALADCDVIAKRGREIYFDCKAKVFASFWTNQSQQIISSVTEGRAFAAKDSAIEIYFAKSGDTIWDIAKELKVPKELIVGQNPTLVSPLATDEKVVVYYGIE
jgi:hypothetical protein